MLITADQIRAARALKSWSQTDLAERCGLAVPTIANIELGKQMPGKNTIEKIVSAFETNGIAFLDNEGVVKKSNPITTFQGKEGIRRFFDLVYDTIQMNGGKICTVNIDEKKFDDMFDESFDEFHRDRMEQLGDKLDFKALGANSKQRNPNATYVDYRIMDTNDFSGVPYYVFNDSLAMIFLTKEPTIVVIHNAEAAKLYRESFLSFWKKAKKPEPLKKSKK